MIFKHGLVKRDLQGPTEPGAARCVVGFCGRKVLGRFGSGAALPLGGILEAQGVDT